MQSILALNRHNHLKINENNEMETADVMKLCMAVFNILIGAKPLLMGCFLRHVFGDEIPYLVSWAIASLYLVIIVTGILFLVSKHAKRQSCIIVAHTVKQC